ncbi:MAG: 50S ribosomal protein L11 methyltransferase [Proteobacteria bacterium]|nr:50S ribosomal protein L11 methyltransferase [Pseudomonadota bacterium]MBU1685734.1 50S ribosomal protein L11 methyltransferase [Pseudomonadota bacterium]
MTQKSWRKIILRCPTAVEDALSSYLGDLTGSGVEIIENPQDSTISTIYAYLLEDDPNLPDTLNSIRDYLQDLAQQFPAQPRTVLQLDSIEDQDWHRKWKESFKPFRLSANLIVKPSWETYQPSPQKKIIEIDPGMAFGTGLHASTRLATELIEEYLLSLPEPPARVLDVGTGTAILAIAAALLGCQNIIAIDNDPEAVSAATANIKANHLSSAITASGTDLDDLPGQYDLIIANIIHNTLVEMVTTLNHLLAPNGCLILAGILTGEQTENIIKVYESEGLLHIKTATSQEWSALRLGNK